MRKYYVGMTRAKKGLFIHTNSDIFSGLDGCRYFTDKSVYSMPEEIVLQLTHKDVFLDFFKTRKKEILSMRSGDSLAFFENRLYHIGEHDERSFCVAMLSVSMKEKLNLWREKGYEVVAVDRKGNFAMPYNSQGMFRGFLYKEKGSSEVKKG